MSKRFENEAIKFLDYQSNISKSLIINGLDNQTQLSSYLCLIIKGLDHSNQDQESNNQINQYLQKSLTGTLGRGSQEPVDNVEPTCVCCHGTYASVTFVLVALLRIVVCGVLGKDS